MALAQIIQEHTAPPFRPAPWSVPTHKQLVTDAATDPAGRVWLRLATTGIRGSPVVRFRTTNSPVEGVLHYHDGFRYAAFDADMRFLGVIDLPGSYSMVAFGVAHVWAVEEGSDGLQYLVRFDLPER